MTRKEPFGGPIEGKSEGVEETLSHIRFDGYFSLQSVIWGRIV
jgi:hypothetical protein